MHDATIVGLDPSVPIVDQVHRSDDSFRKRQRIWKGLKETYISLPKEAREHFNSIRDHYEKRASLMTLYENAHRLKDTEMKAEANVQINAWNRQYPKAKISVNQIIQSIDKRQEFSRKQVGGVVLNDKYKGQVEAYR